MSHYRLKPTGYFILVTLLIIITISGAIITRSFNHELSLSYVINNALTLEDVPVSLDMNLNTNGDAVLYKQKDLSWSQAFEKNASSIVLHDKGSHVMDPYLLMMNRLIRLEDGYLAQYELKRLNRYLKDKIQHEADSYTITLSIDEWYDILSTFISDINMDLYSQETANELRQLLGQPDVPQALQKMLDQLKASSDTMFTDSMIQLDYVLEEGVLSSFMISSKLYYKHCDAYEAFDLTLNLLD